MSRTAIALSFLVAVLGVSAVGAVAHAVTQDTFADTRAIVEFQRTADRYAFLHRQVERKLGLAHRRAGEATDIGERELAAALIAERAANRIELFSSTDVVTAFRNLAARAVRAPGCDAGELRSGVWEMTHQVNSPASDTRPIAGCIALLLPDLPVELEYRSAGTVLLVVDVHANLVVDVLPALLAGSDLR